MSVLGSQGHLRFMFIIALIIMLVSSQIQYRPITTLNVIYPCNIQSLGKLAINDIIKVMVIWKVKVPLTLILAKQGIKIREVTEQESPIMLKYVVEDPGQYIVRVNSSSIPPIIYHIHAKINHDFLNITNNKGVSYNYLKGVYSIQVQQSCQRAIVNVPQLGNKFVPVIHFFAPSAIPNIFNIDLSYTFSKQLTKGGSNRIQINFFQPGNWYIIPQDGFSVDPKNSLIIQNQVVLQITCLLCGDSIRQQGEQCDNGNQTGCINCMVQKGWKCQGQIGKYSKCVCSNQFFKLKQKQGKEVCQIDCSLINGTVEQSSNSSQCTCKKPYIFNPLITSCILCSKLKFTNGEYINSRQCSCIQGYYWDLTLFSCQKLQRQCGNGIKQRGEDCDDGNQISGNGCSSNCQTQSTDNIDLIQKLQHTLAKFGEGISTNTLYIIGAVAIFITIFGIFYLIQIRMQRQQHIERIRHIQNQHRHLNLAEERSSATIANTVAVNSISQICNIEQTSKNEIKQDEEIIQEIQNQIHAKQAKQ